MSGDKCPYCNVSASLEGICSFCKADQKAIPPKAILPANEPGRFDIKLKYPPRRMFPFHAEGVTTKSSKYAVPFIGKPWTLDLIAVPMESVRKTFKFRRTETPTARKHLQTWINNLGSALYNPVGWKLQMFYEARRLSPSGRLLKKGLYIRQYDGMHRIRALEALDFNFIYVFFALGYVTPTREQTGRAAMLMRPAIRYHGRKPGRCEKCGGPIKWAIKERGYEFIYKCPRCSHVKIYPVVYPEPV